MAGWRHSITLRLSLAFALLATVVFAALGLYFSRAADAHMAELDAHDLFGKLALIGHVGTQEHSPETFAARLGDALIGEHGVIVTVSGSQGQNLHMAKDRTGQTAGCGQCAAAWRTAPASSW